MSPAGDSGGNPTDPLDSTVGLSTPARGPTSTDPSVDPFEPTRLSTPTGPSVDPFEPTRDVAPLPPDISTLLGDGGSDTDVPADAPWFDEVSEPPTDTTEDGPPSDETVRAMVDPDLIYPVPPQRLAAACPQCRFVGEKSARFCVRCGGDMRVEPPTGGNKPLKTPPVPGPSGGEPQTSSTPSMAPGEVAQGPQSVGSCPDCDATIRTAAGHCPSCGRVLGEMMVLVVITPEGDEGQRLTPVVGVAFLGRNEAVEFPFPDDPYLSPSHVRLSVTQEAVFIEDQQTLNGTFMRLQQAVSIGPGDTFVVGRQLLRLEAVGQPASGESTSADGTRLLGSPPPSGGFVLVQLSANGRVQDRYHLPAGGGAIGRDAGEVRFPADRYVSGKHATVAIDNKDKVTLLDMDSSNGTWVRLRRRTPLGAGDEIYVGSQVFRVTFPVA